DVLDALVDNYIPPQSLEEQWNVSGLQEALEGEVNLRLPLQQWLDEDHNLHEEILRQRIQQEMEAAYEAKAAAVGSEVIRHVEKEVTLHVLDTQWKDHLATMDQLRQGIHLRGYAQKDPKQEYKRESFELFAEMLERFKNEVISILCKIQIRSEEEVEAMEAQRRRVNQEQMQFQHAEAAALAQSEAGEEATQPYVREGRKVGRNEPCPCGSGKKYKHCHGRLN
ncbi:MAG: SEC-C metal-binding domain-containing protein, partial [Gammaproteobacteria bacterium]